MIRTREHIRKKRYPKKGPDYLVRFALRVLKIKDNEELAKEYEEFKAGLGEYLGTVDPYAPSTIFGVAAIGLYVRERLK